MKSYVKPARLGKKSIKFVPKVIACPQNVRGQNRQSAKNSKINFGADAKVDTGE